MGRKGIENGRELKIKFPDTILTKLNRPMATSIRKILFWTYSFISGEITQKEFIENVKKVFK